MACSFRGFKRKTLDKMTTYILHRWVFGCSVVGIVFLVPMRSANAMGRPLWKMSTSGRVAFFKRKESAVSLFYFFTKFISQVLQEENTHECRAQFRVSWVTSPPPERPPVLCGVLERPRSCRPAGVRAPLRPLAGAGLAALLSVELVVTDAVLGDQVTPAEVVHAVFVCRENKKIIRLD